MSAILRWAASGTITSIAIIAISVLAIYGFSVGIKCINDKDKDNSNKIVLIVGLVLSILFLLIGGFAMTAKYVPAFASAANTISGATIVPV